jgi:hypothetical protein
LKYRIGIFPVLFMTLVLVLAGCNGSNPSESHPVQAAKPPQQKTDAPKKWTLRDVLEKAVGQAKEQNGFSYRINNYSIRSLKRANVSTEFRNDLRIEANTIHEPFAYDSKYDLIDHQKKKYKGETVIAGKWVYHRFQGKQWRKYKLKEVDKLSIPTRSLQFIDSLVQSRPGSEPEGIQMTEDGAFYEIKVTRTFLDTTDSFRKSYSEVVLGAVQEDLKALRKLGATPNTRRLRFLEFTQVYKIDKTRFHIVEFKEDIGVQIPAGKFTFRYHVASDYHYTGSFQGTISAPVKK